jgi:hypothetical protein
MSHGYIPPEPRPPLFVVTHGLTLTAYVEGLPVAVKRLAQHEAANLAIDLADWAAHVHRHDPARNVKSQTDHWADQ